MEKKEKEKKERRKKGDGGIRGSGEIRRMKHQKS